MFGQDRANRKITSRRKSFENQFISESVSGTVTIGQNEEVEVAGPVAYPERRQNLFRPQVQVRNETFATMPTMVASRKRRLDEPLE